MVDQAQALRNLVRNHKGSNNDISRSTKVITVSSGKGGVGKSNFTVNFAIALQRLGRKVLVFDADMGMANIDILMGVSSRLNLYHLLKREAHIRDIIQTGPADVQYIAGGSGFHELLNLSEEDLLHFTNQVSEIASDYDFIIFDTGAGLSKQTLNFILASEETFIVTTPEPTSITDAYALVKMVHRTAPGTHFKLIVNRVANELEGQQTADRLNLVCQQFLDLRIPPIGFIQEDSNVSNAVKRQTPFTIAFPNSVSSRHIEQLALAYLNNSSQPPRLSRDSGVKGFLSKLLKVMK